MKAIISGTKCLKCIAMSQGKSEDNRNQPGQAKTARRGFFYGYIVLAAGFVIWLVGWGIFSPSFGVLLLPVVTEFGWSRSEAILGYSLSTIVYGPLAIIMGRLTDKLGPRTVVTVFGSFMGISYLLMSQISALWQFQLNYALLVAIGTSTISIPIMATIVRWFVRRRGLMVGIVQAGLGLGGVIFAPLTAWLILTYGWRLSYATLGAIALIGFIAAGLFLKSDPRDVGQLPDGAREITTSVKEEHGEHVKSKGISVRQAVRTRQFWIIAGLNFSFGYCRSAFTPHTAAYVQDKGFSLIDGANVVAALTVASILGRIVMGRVADIIGNRAALLISEALTPISLALALIAGDLWGLYIFGIIFGFGWGAQAVLRFTVASEEFGVSSIGALMGVLGLAEAVAASSGAYLSGYIFDVAGNYQPTFWLGIAIAIVGIILALLKPAHRKVTG